MKSMLTTNFLPLFVLIFLCTLAGTLFLLLRRNEHLKEEARIAEAGGRELAREVVERIKSEESLTEISELRARFVSSVSHELRTPLTSIQGFARTILLDPDMPVFQIREFVKIIEEESLRLGNLVSDILQLSSIDSGKMCLKVENVGVEELVERATRNLVPMLTSKKLKMQVAVKDAPQLSADSEKLLMVLTNLLGNAAKFSPEGGTIIVRGFRDGGEIVLEVEDNGRGIPQDEQSKIFERFHRVDYPGEELGGTGLGLAISKEIVELHHGQLRVKSQLGKGSTFSVRLPQGK